MNNQEIWGKVNQYKQFGFQTLNLAKPKEITKEQLLEARNKILNLFSDYDLKSFEDEPTEFLIEQKEKYNFCNNKNKIMIKIKVLNKLNPEICHYENKVICNVYLDIYGQSKTLNQKMAELGLQANKYINLELDSLNNIKDYVDFESEYIKKINSSIKIKTHEITNPHNYDIANIRSELEENEFVYQLTLGSAYAITSCKFWYVTKEDYEQQ